MKNSNALTLQKNTYDSDDEDSARSDEEIERLSPHTRSPARVSELPIPETLLKFLADESEESKSHNNPQLYDGRTRSFPPERGNWATCLYDPIRSQNSINTISNKLLPYVQTVSNFRTCSDVHVSFSRAVVLRHHWIQLFIDGVRKDIEKCESFPIEFDGSEKFVNDERTCTFLAVEVTLRCDSLSQLVKCTDQNLFEFNLPSYYENPSFHASIFWCVGYEEKELITVKSTLQECLDELKAEDPELLLVDINEVHCKVGNRLYRFSLRDLI